MPFWLNDCLEPQTAGLQARHPKQTSTPSHRGDVQPPARRACELARSCRHSSLAAGAQGHGCHGARSAWPRFISAAVRKAGLTCVPASAMEGAHVPRQTPPPSAAPWESTQSPCAQGARCHTVQHHLAWCVFCRSKQGTAGAPRDPVQAAHHGPCCNSPCCFAEIPQYWKSILRQKAKLQFSVIRRFKKKIKKNISHSTRLELLRTSSIFIQKLKSRQIYFV